MQIVENTAVKFSIPAKLADSIYQHVEKCEVVSTDVRSKELLIYWGHDEMRVAATVIDEAQPNVLLPKLPSPILKDYNWPGVS